MITEPLDTSCDQRRTSQEPREATAAPKPPDTRQFRIEAKVGDLQRVSGTITKYADGSEYRDTDGKTASGHGVALPVTYTVVDQNGKPLDPGTDGGTFIEDVERLSVLVRDVRRLGRVDYFVGERCL